MGECRKVLLLLDESGGFELSEDEAEEVTEMDEDSEGRVENEATSCIPDTLNFTNCTLIPTSQSSSDPLEKPQTPIQQTFSPSHSSPQTTTTSISSRRSVSEELFDHLTHDLRVMQFSQESRE